MKQTLGTMALVAALSGFSVATDAQTVVLSDNFDSYSLGAFGSTYNFASGGNVTSTIVAPGAGGAGRALQLSGNITNGVSENAGVNSPVYTPGGNTDPNLSDYTLSFDLAITAGANSGVGVTLNIFGGTAQANGSSYTVPISQNTVGGGFQHYPVNMGSLPAGYQIPALDPTYSQYQFQLLFLGYNASVTATPETVLLDNLQITVTPNTNALTGPYYVNPPIYADYPDPDIIRLTNDFYFATTTFIDVPGLSILHSQDLVHWEIVSHVVSQLTGSPNDNITDGVANYRNGVFAPSLRYYNGTFYVVVTPNGQATRVYYSTDIHGPWPYYQLSVGAFDPGFYIETNGVGYIFSSGGWDGHVTVFTLNANYSQVVTTTTNVFYYPNIEGSKVVKRGSYYYVFNAQPPTASLYVSRATNLFGPYTSMKVLDDSKGGHQGAIVDLPVGTDYGFVMKDSGPIGRMTYICPIIWSNNWPVWGTSNAPGRVPATAPMPIVGKPAYSIATSDDFSSSTLNLQWQWNHNPDNTRWSLTERPGFLRLHPMAATNFWYARNTIIQKGQGPRSGAAVKFDLSNLQAGDVCGFGTLGKTNGNIAVKCNSPGSFTLSMNVIDDGHLGTNLTQRVVATTAFTGTTIYLRTGLDFIRNKGICSYSSDGITWTTLGGEFNLAYDWASGTFQGEQFAIFCYNPQPGTGYVDVDWFRFVPPAFINDIVQNPDSSMTLYFENSPYSTNVIRASSNLGPAAAWQDISTNKADGSGIWQFTDTNASLSPAQFYCSYTR